MFGLPLSTTWLVIGVPVFWVLYTLGLALLASPSKEEDPAGAAVVLLSEFGIFTLCVLMPGLATWAYKKSLPCGLESTNSGWDEGFSPSDMSWLAIKALLVASV